MLRQRAAAHVVHRALRHAHDASAACPKSPAEVNLFHVREEAAVQSAHGFPVRAAYHQGCARGPEYRGDAVVLPFVGLHHAEHAPPAKGVAVAVDVAAASTGVFKLRALALAEQFGLAGGRFGVLLHIAEQRREPVGRNLNIRIEQKVIVGFQPAQRLVVALREPVVLAERQAAYRGKLCRQHLERPVRRAVVRHDDFCRAGGVVHHGGQEAAHHLLAVPVENNDCYFGIRHNQIFVDNNIIRLLVGISCGF